MAKAIPENNQDFLRHEFTHTPVSLVVPSPSVLSAAVSNVMLLPNKAVEATADPPRSLRREGNKVAFR